MTIRLAHLDMVAVNMTLIKYHKGKLYAIEGLGDRPSKKTHPTFGLQWHNDFAEWEERFNSEGVEVELNRESTPEEANFYSSFREKYSHRDNLFSNLEEGDFIIAEVEIKENRAYLK